MSLLISVLTLCMKIITLCLALPAAAVVSCVRLVRTWVQHPSKTSSSSNDNAQVESDDDDKPRSLTVLLTGTRSPFTLELARMFHNQGHRVISAESQRVHVSDRSNAIDKHYFIKSRPNRQPRQYAKALARAAVMERVDLVVPTCEELYWVSEAAPVIQMHRPSAAIFTMEKETLRHFHSKWLFAQLVGRLAQHSDPVVRGRDTEQLQQLPFRVPLTHRVTSLQELEDVLALPYDIVLKPEYSRFSTHVLMRPQSMADVPASVQDQIQHLRVPYVAQQYVDGVQLCTYGVACNGQLLAHADYYAHWTAGQGASVAFEPAGEEAVQRLVDRLVRGTNYTGQLAFDLIYGVPSGGEDGEGSSSSSSSSNTSPAWYFIECNPRSTCGIHLFNPGTGSSSTPHPVTASFVNCFTQFASLRPGADTLPPQPIVCPDPQHTVAPAVSAALVLFNLFGPRGPGWQNPTHLAFVAKALQRWASLFVSCRDVVFDPHDPKPALLQGLPVAYSALIALWYRISIFESSTYDIEWNGD